MTYQITKSTLPQIGRNVGFGWRLWKDVLGAAMASNRAASDVVRRAIYAQLQQPAPAQQPRVITRRSRDLEGISSDRLFQRHFVCSDGLWGAAKERAALYGMTVSHYVRFAVWEYLHGEERTS